MTRDPTTTTVGLVSEVQRSHHVMLATLAGMLFLSLLSSGYLLLVSAPRVSQETELAREASQVLVAMVNQETGLRGWLGTADPVFLEPYQSGKESAAQGSELLLTMAGTDSQAASQIVDILVARAAWDTWAQDAAQRDQASSPVSPAALTQFLLDGKALFDVYRAADARAMQTFTQRRDQALTDQRTALFGLLVANLLVVAVSGVFAVRRNRRLAVTVLAPIRGVLSTIDALRSGDLTARSGATGVVELDAVESALSGLASGLAQAQELAAGRAKRLELLAARLETVVRVAREISGSLSVRYVSEAVTTAAAELLGSPTVLWVRDEEGRFHAASQSDQPHGWVGNDLAVPDLVAESADNARTTFDETSRAYPLVLAGMVVGVLRLIATEVDPDVENTLGALLSTAAASLESARLHSAADELALTDALTHLPNRRRMESELEVEWDRSKRYGRPLSFLMIDLDHFKALNDEFGHTVGDEVLRSVAAAVQASLRASDTAYRYGGEELAVLLRETGPDDAALVGERIRAAVAAVTLHNTSARVTASVGLAERSSEMRFGIELVAAADTALYVAKKQGRDRVVHLSVLPTEPGRQARPSA